METTSATKLLAPPKETEELAFCFTCFVREQGSLMPVRLRYGFPELIQCPSCSQPFWGYEVVFGAHFRFGTITLLAPKGAGAQIATALPTLGAVVLRGFEERVEQRVAALEQHDAAPHPLLYRLLRQCGPR